MKLVINRCYGGFSLSPEAAREVHKRGGDIRVHSLAQYFGTGASASRAAQTALADWRSYQAGGRPFTIHTFTEDETGIIEQRPSNRACPVLVAVVTEMGAKANGEHAKLHVVEIPDGIGWEIDEYDGMETVEEVHRSWS